jgi:benzoyl-CoA-dihydrodiol lyase
MGKSPLRVEYQVEPTRYRHWKLSVEGAVATLALDVAEDGGIVPGYRLKLNSYDLGVDIELYDAVNRIRFEYPEVRCVVMTSLKDRVFCSGANIFMLGQSSHAWKVNFCKFTNETRNGLEDSSRYSGLKFIAAINGSCAGGGYELALACDEIILIDDRSSAVSLPEVPLLGVLPGTGGLTRLIDKRHVRHDHADLFCTTSEGVRGQRALDWRLVDRIARPAQFDAAVSERAAQLCRDNPGRAGAVGVALTPLLRTHSGDRIDYPNVSVAIQRDARCATWLVRAPATAQPRDVAGIMAAGARWWPLALARELDDAILWMRTNEPDIGVWLLKTEGDPAAVLSSDATMHELQAHWLVQETLGWLRRSLARLEVSARSLFALIESGSCFAGTLAELALACDRTYMQSTSESGTGASFTLSAMNFGPLPMINGLPRLAQRYYGDEAQLAAARATLGVPQDAAAALGLGLITAAPDELDWADEIRMAIEERAAMSPDALTGLEASLRFGGPENMNTRIFGRLSAWQNWIFIRPNASGEKGALKVYGTGEKTLFDWSRV